MNNLIKLYIESFNPEIKITNIKKDKEVYYIYSDQILFSIFSGINTKEFKSFSRKYKIERLLK